MTDTYQSALYTAEVFDAYEKRFAEARLNKPLRDPANAEHRAQILREAEQMLCLDQIPAPKIKILAQSDELHGDVTVRFLQFCSWEHCYGEATLFLPKGYEGKKLPTVVICNGHSAVGRMGESYQHMAFQLAARGMVALASDNLGHGSREVFGHGNAKAPLCSGITLQGMIVRETNAWIDWLRVQDFVDVTRLGACGNSGGGTLTLFLAATNPHLAALASSGYPSDFSYTMLKEKKHCCCNLLRGCTNLAEMWEIYATFAPKPLLLSSGECDCIFPANLFRRAARKVETVYRAVDAGKHFEYRLTDTKHSWEREDHLLISDFFRRHFVPDCEVRDFITYETYEPRCRFTYPADAISTDALAVAITGRSEALGMELEEYCPPTINGVPVDASLLDATLFDADPMRILAQMEFSMQNP